MKAQLINYLIYHKAMTMRMAEDKSIKPIDRCVWNTLFVKWNESEWAPEIEASTAWVMEATGIGNKGTAGDALERLNAAGYITVKTSRGNGGGTFITLPEYSKEEISKWPKSGLFKESKCTRSGLLEPKSNSPEVDYSNGTEVGDLRNSNRPEVVHSYTSIPIVQTLSNVETVSSPNGELVESTLSTPASKGEDGKANPPAASANTSHNPQPADPEEADAPEASDIPAFKTIGKDIKSLSAYITQFRPKRADAYFALWNLFADKHAFPKLQSESAERKRKVRTRAGEEAFDFVKVLSMAAKSTFLKESDWFTFDWIVKNGGNYVKVLEGNYSKNPLKQKQDDNPAQELSAPAAAIQQHLNRQQQQPRST